jgi:hypothetical protein
MWDFTVDEVTNDVLPFPLPFTWQFIIHSNITVCDKKLGPLVVAVRGTGRRKRHLNTDEGRSLL